MAISINGNGITSTEIVDGSIQPNDLAQKMTLMTAQNATGTSVDFTGIPSWAKRITVMFNEVSTSGSSVLCGLVGDGVIVNTGYKGGTIASGVGGSPGGIANVNGCNLTYSSTTAATYKYTGKMTLELTSNNTWIINSNIINTISISSVVSSTVVALISTLDRIRITTVNGTDLFDAGSINVMYEG